jgi:glycerol kinase
MGIKFIISIDLGTTGNRVFCYNVAGTILSTSYREFTQFFPKPGWVEHDPEEIWVSVLSLITETLDKGQLNPLDALVIGITNQRETTVLWNKKTGKSIYNAIVWQCRRTSEICENLKSSGYSEYIHSKTGLMIDPYFSATKISWLLDNVPHAKELSAKNLLCFGTIDSWILWKLTNGIMHKTDYTNASRTMLYNIIEKNWDKDLLDLFSIPSNILPEVCNSSGYFGATKSIPCLPDGIPIGGIAGDQQAAMVGQNCVSRGSLKNTYGTGCFLLQNTGDVPVFSQNGLITTLACDNSGKPSYAIEGSIFIAGAVIQWLRDYMKFLSNSSDAESISQLVIGGSEVVVVPAFVGLGAPYWNNEVRGAILGLTRDTTQEQIVQAANKSIALQSYDVVQAMNRDIDIEIKHLNVDGGATRDRYLMQYQADILGFPIKVPENIETTSLGAAYLAGMSIGLFSTISEISIHNKTLIEYVPSMPDTIRDKEISRWENAIHILLYHRNKTGGEHEQSITRRNAS